MKKIHLLSFLLATLGYVSCYRNPTPTFNSVKKNCWLPIDSLSTEKCKIRALIDTTNHSNLHKDNYAIVVSYGSLSDTALLNESICIEDTFRPEIYINDMPFKYLLTDTSAFFCICSFDPQLFLFKVDFKKDLIVVHQKLLRGYNFFFNNKFIYTRHERMELNGRYAKWDINFNLIDSSVISIYD